MPARVDTLRQRPCVALRFPRRCAPRTLSTYVQSNLHARSVRARPSWRSHIELKLPSCRGEGSGDCHRLVTPERIGSHYGVSGFVLTAQWLLIAPGVTVWG